MISFEHLYLKQAQNFPTDGILLAIDPGETTGFTVIGMTEDIPSIPKHMGHGQLNTESSDKAAHEISNLFSRFSPTHVVFEEYRVYASHAKQHIGSDLMTSRVIGMIEMECHKYKIKPHKQMAQLAKHFCTDDKLRNWNYWYKGLKHARDSARHALYYLLFVHKKAMSKEH